MGDIEKLREHLGIERWLVFGGSWGSTLALSYAITHPQCVIGLVLRGIFLCRKAEIHWFYQEGASNIFPDAWDRYLAPIPPDERGDMVSAYYKRLTSVNMDERIAAAKAWSMWEATTSHLFIDEQAVANFDNPELALAFARIECHYFIHNAFFRTDNYLIENAYKISHIPTRIVQGRYDMVCPMRSAWDLCKVLTGADLRIVPDAGHSALEPGNARELIQATDDFKRLFD